MLFIKVLCILAPIMVVLYLLMIMPRVVHKPDRLPHVGVRYAHRGLHDNTSMAPENTMAAFKKAVDAGYGIECDVMTIDEIAKELSISKEEAIELKGQAIRMLKHPSRSRIGYPILLGTI